MKKDITCRDDIALMVSVFYKKIANDTVLGAVFNGEKKIDWDKHIPAMCDFWENALFQSGNYKGNPMNLHQHLHKVMPLNEVHFRQWNILFIETIDELFSGHYALLAKQRALNISQIIQQQLFAGKQTR